MTKMTKILDTVSFPGMLVGIPCLLGAGTVGLRKDTPTDALAVMVVLGVVGLISFAWGLYRSGAEDI